MAINGQLPQGNDDMIGKPTERLNPDWVAQLMGTTLKHEFFRQYGNGVVSQTATKAFNDVSLINI